MYSSSDSTAHIVQFPADDLPPVLVPPGEYDLAFVAFETKAMFRKSAKVILRFKIASPGAGFGRQVERYYNATKLTGKAGRGGCFKIGARSDLLLEYVNLFCERPPRLDRIPMSRFDNRIIRARLRTVSADHRQRKLHELLNYSVVAELLEVLN